MQIPFRFQLLLMILIGCSAAQQSKQLTNTPKNYSKVELQYQTEISELGLTKLTSAQNPFWNVNSYDVSLINSNMETITQNYLKDNSLLEYDSLFKTNNFFRQYAGINGVNHERLLLVRFYNKQKIKTRYGEHYADTLNVIRGPYFHFYPDFYFMIYNLQMEKVVYMKW
jgi:hypothetical protein